MRRSVLLIALLCGARALAGDGPSPRRGEPGAAPVTSRTWRNATLERTRRLVFEVIDDVRVLHVDGESVSSDKMREDAIEAMRAHAASRSFHLLEGDARERFRRALQHVPEGDLEACLAVVDSHLTLRTPEQAQTVCDVLARGAISATGDPFTKIIDGRAAERLERQLAGHRPAAYGINVGETEFGVPKVEHVLRGFDAFEKGIQDGDTIVEVDGHPTVLSSREEILRRLQGDTKVVLRIWREGFAHGHDVEICACEPRGPSVDGEMLAGSVGYVRLDSFDEQTPGALESLLKKLERQGMRALILDLRDDPGGSMTSCVAVASEFLGPKQVVCRTFQRDEGTKVCTTEGEAVLSSQTPMLVLTNRGSASASEMLAGALRDNRRARLVGTRTYGKGVGQLRVPLENALDERVLLVSSMRYTAPGGQSPQKDGLSPEPAFLVPRFAYTAADQEELLRLSAENAFERYIGDHQVQDEPLLVALSTDDEGKPEKYPGFGAWRASLQTTLEPQKLRRALRASIRSWASLKKEKPFRGDLEDDEPLRHAYEILAPQVPPPHVSPPPAPEPRKYY